MIWNNTGLIGLRMDAMHEDNNLLFSTSEVGLTIPQRPKCKAATLGSNALKTKSNTVGISKTQNAGRAAHTEHIE